MKIFFICNFDECEPKDQIIHIKLMVSNTSVRKLL